ncbi:gametocyte-specific factor 1-like [Nasonia vitripennis]|uniref:CHHC U11-48K-type domain-containing protein n=1 Tax=Nasonia vitripennis TaxID=7425 RepID=A0A7M7PUI0_NASVI|nr:gametocyte-specific factor 1-like [Nasonia vitripennis]
MAAEEPLEVCPFDKSHRIRGSRMAYHIRRCANSHPEIQLKICPYNSRHILHPKQLSEHLRSCPTKEFANPDKIVETTPETSGVIIPVQPEFVAVDEAVEAWVVDEGPSPLEGVRERRNAERLFRQVRRSKKRN